MWTRIFRKIFFLSEKKLYTVSEHNSQFGCFALVKICKSLWWQSRVYTGEYSGGLMINPKDVLPLSMSLRMKNPCGHNIPVSLCSMPKTSHGCYIANGDTTTKNNNQSLKIKDGH